MNTAHKNSANQHKVNDQLMPFVVAGTETERASLDRLDVFHTQFSSVDTLPEARDVLSERTYAQGLEEGRVLAASEGAMHLQTSSELVQGLQGNLKALGVQIQASHNRAIAMVLRSVLPELAKHSVGTEISQFLQKVAGQAMNGEVIINVNPEFETKMTAITEALGSTGFDALQFTITPDASLSGTAINVNWVGGGGDIDVEGAVQHCLQLLEPQSTD